MTLVRGIRSDRQRIRNPTEAEVYASCVQELDASFQIANAIFRSYDELFASGLHPVRSQVTDSAMEYFSAGLRLALPMSPLEAMDTLWDFGSQIYVNKEEFMRFDDVQVNNTRIESFIESSVLQSGKQVKIQQYFIARRFYHDNRAFMAWHFISEGMGVFTGLRADETGWFRLEPSSSPMEPGTVLEMRVGRAPDSMESAFPEAVTMNFHRVIRRIREKTMGNMVTSIETALLGNLLDEIDSLL